jgi:hypothetical protein
MSTVPSVAAIRFAIASSADVVSAASAVSVAAAVLPPVALSVVSSLLPHAAKETTMLVASNTLNTFFFIENFLPFFFPHFCVSEPFYRLLCICAILLLFPSVLCFVAFRFCVLLRSAFCAIGCSMV